MGKKDNRTSSPAAVQVVELTMDNPEDQDELNRRLRKPGEPDRHMPETNGPATKRPSASESASKKKKKP
jgi:hypothetical protein